MKRRLLWRVRRKLILSYIFIGVVPALLIVVFFLLGGLLFFDERQRLPVQGRLRRRRRTTRGWRRRRGAELGAACRAPRDAGARRSATRSSAGALVPRRVVRVRAARATATPAARCGAGESDHGRTAARRQCPRGCAARPTGSPARSHRRLAKAPARSSSIVARRSPVVMNGADARLRDRRLPLDDEMIRRAATSRPASSWHGRRGSAETRTSRAVDAGSTEPATARRRRGPRCSEQRHRSRLPPTGRPGDVQRATRLASAIAPARALSSGCPTRSRSQIGDDCRSGRRILLILRRRRRSVPDHPDRRARHGPRAGALDHQRRSTSCSWAPSACATATSRTASTCSPTISSASWPSRSTR